MQDLSRPGDRFCAPVEGWAAAVVPLMLVVHGILHVPAESKTDTEVGGDLTVCRHRLMRYRAALGGEGSQPGEPGGQAGIQPQLAQGPGRHTPRAVQVDQVQAEPGSQFIISEEPGQHRAAGATAHVLEQGPVKHRLQILGLHPERAAELDAHEGGVGAVFHPLCRSQTGAEGKSAQQFGCAPRSRPPACRRDRGGSAAHVLSVARVRGRSQAWIARRVTGEENGSNWGNR